jgi:hypothetical protein
LRLYVTMTLQHTVININTIVKAIYMPKYPYKYAINLSNRAL